MVWSSCVLAICDYNKIKFEHSQQKLYQTLGKYLTLHINENCNNMSLIFSKNAEMQKNTAVFPKKKVSC